MSVVIQQLPKGDLVRFREIDRSEEATLHYRQIGTRLVSEPVKDSIPNFFEECPHSVAELVARWQPVVEEGGILLGAFADGDLVGIALLGGEVAPRVRQLALLFVSRAHRRRGVAGSLTDAMEELARASAAVARGGRVGDEMDEVTPLPWQACEKSCYETQPLAWSKFSTMSATTPGPCVAKLLTIGPCWGTLPFIPKSAHPPACPPW